MKFNDNLKYIYIYIGSRLGVPRSFQEPSVLSLCYKRRYGIEIGGGGVGGCNSVMWSALHWELWKPWGCCFVEDVVTLQVSLLFTEGGWGGWGGVITSFGARWIQSCGNLEDVASLTMLLRCKYLCCSRYKQLLQKAFVDVKMKKVWCSFRPWFSSELWHFLVINKTTKYAWNHNSNG